MPVAILFLARVSLGSLSASPDYSRTHTNPKRKRGLHHHLTSLTLWVGVGPCVAGIPGSRIIRASVGLAWAASCLRHSRIFSPLKPAPRCSIESRDRAIFWVQGHLYPLCREAVLGPAFTPRLGSANPEPSSVSPPLAARRRTVRGSKTQASQLTRHKGGPNTTSRRSPLKRPRYGPSEVPALQNRSATIWQGYDQGRASDPRPSNF